MRNLSLFIFLVKILFDFDLSLYICLSIKFYTMYAYLHSYYLYTIIQYIYICMD